MDHRQLFGIAAIILSGSVFILSLKSANAFPQGPNVSMGSNPIEHHSGGCLGNSLLFSNNTSSQFILTDILYYANSGYSTLTLQGQTLATFNGTTIAALNSGIKIGPGENLHCTSGWNGNQMTISGYYTH